MGIHKKIHRKQINEIVRNVRNSSDNLVIAANVNTNPKAVTF